MKSEQQPVVGGREGVVKTGRSRRVDKIFRTEGEREGEKTHRRPLPWCPPSCVFFLPEEKTTEALEVLERKRKMLDEQILQLRSFEAARVTNNFEDAQTGNRQQIIHP